eukprot:559271-Rhodomonas_salina.1
MSSSMPMIWYQHDLGQYWASRSQRVGDRGATSVTYLTPGSTIRYFSTGRRVETRRMIALHAVSVPNIGQHRLIAPYGM